MQLDYRLFDQDDVTFRALCEPHWQLTRARNGGTWLLIGDTTEIEFGIQRDVSGLAGAELFHRQPAPEKETLTQKKNRDRESEVWGGRSVQSSTE